MNDKPNDSAIDPRIPVAPIVEAILAAASWAGYRIYRLGGETLSVLLALGIGILYFGSGLAARQSADLSSLRPNFERWFSQSFDGARAEAGDLEIRWNPSDDTVAFTASDVVVYAKDGRKIQTLALLRATTTKSDLMGLTANLRDVEIIGGEVTWLRKEDGSIIAGLGNPGTVGGFGPIYEGRSERNEPFALEWLDAFRSVTLVDSVANIVDRKDGLDLSVDVQQLSGLRSGDDIDLNVEATVGVTQDQGTFSFVLESDDSLQTVSLALLTENVRLGKLAPERGRLSVLQGLEVPLDADLRATYNRDTGLQSASLDLIGADGNVVFAGNEQKVRSVKFSGALDPGAEAMNVYTLSVDAERLTFSGQGEIREIGRLYDGDVGTSPKFDLSLDESVLDLTPIFEAPLRVTRAQALGELDLDAQTLTLDQLNAAFDDFSLTMRAKVATSDAGLSQVTLIGATETPMTAPDLLSLWPVKSADGARRWIDRSVEGGTLHNVRFSVDLDEAFFTAPSLTEERLQLEFDVQDGIVRYIGPMPPLTDAFGSGRINGNSFGMVLDRGRIDGISIVGGDVSIPRLIPHGGDIYISAEAEGQAAELLELINYPPFQYLDRYGVKPDGFGGTANITLNIKRPLLEYFDQNRIEYSVDGTFNEASVPFEVGPFSFKNADVSVKGGKDGLFVSGLANIGSWRPTIAWEERYGQNGEPTRYRINGKLGREALDGFGVGLREFFGGDIQVDIEASGQGLNITDAALDLDLDEAEISFGDIWSKEVGEPAQFDATLKRESSGFTLSDLSLQASGLELEGRIDLEESLALREALFTRVMVDSLMEGQMSLRPDTGSDRLYLNASGQSLNVSNFVSAGLKTAGQPTSEAIAFAIDAEFETIKLAEDYVLDNAVFAYRNDGVAIEGLDLMGQRPNGALQVSLKTSDETGSRQAMASIPDLSKATQEILGVGAIKGGTFLISADFPPAGETGAILGRATATEFTVQRAPFLAQILSLASLTGIVDTLSGEGLGFDELDFEFGLQDRILSVRDARLRGPAIGMTGEGDINLDERTIDFGGTLVPAYTANSFLGDIPLLGDLFVGKDGEGVFAVTYTIDGSYSQAQIAINPLSALTPGFIRGIFQEDREDLPESVITDVESVRPESAED